MINPHEQFIDPVYSNPEELLLLNADEQVGQQYSRSVGAVALGLPGRAYERLQRAAISFQTEPGHYTKRTIQTAVVAGEFSPLNEAIRYGALAYALSHTDGGWLVGGAVLGATTFAVEAPAAVAAADLVTSEKGNKVLTSVNEFVEKKVPNNYKMSPAVEFGVAMVGGSAVVIAEKQREDQTRTAAMNKKHGLFTASWMSAYFAAEGAFIGANNEGDLLDAKTIGAAVLATAVTWAGAKVSTRTLRRDTGNKALAKAE